MFDQHDGLVINKAMGVVGKSIDHRSQVLDPAINDYRNYNSLSEVFTKLTGETPYHTQQIRKGQFFIFVEEVPGTVVTYWFLHGQENNDLEVVIPEATGGDFSLNEGTAFSAE